MKNDEAKFILNGYRPDGSDGQDAMFCEALRQAQSDPALGAWFQRSRAHDANVAGKLMAIEPPAGLREAILTGARVSRAKRTSWLQPAWMAAAAAVAVLLVAAATLWPRKAQAETALVSFAMSDALEPTRHGGHGTDEKGLQAELGAPGAKLGRAVPVDFARLAKTGCRTLQIEGRPVLEVCFEREGTWFHCYIVQCADFPTLAAKQAPVFAVNAGMTAMSWADGAHRFIVAGQARREAFERLL